MELQQLMRERRHLLGMSQNMAAHRAGISRVQWSRIEAGQIANPRQHTVGAILRALDAISGGAVIVTDKLAFNDWARCPIHRREIPVRNGQAFCARCQGWFLREAIK